MPSASGWGLQRPLGAIALIVLLLITSNGGANAASSGSFNALWVGQ